MKPARRRFGPLFYVTCTIAALILISRPFWEGAQEQFRAWRLIGRLHDQSEVVRREAATGLAQLGPAATSWVIRAMRDPDPAVRSLACSILVRTTSDRAEEVLAALLAAAKDSDPTVRASAVQQLEFVITQYGSMRETSIRQRALRAIGESLGDDSSRVRSTAGWAFINLGPAARLAKGDLIRALDGPDKLTRVLVARALLQVDPHSKRAAVSAAMTPMLTDKSIRREHYQLVVNLIDAQGVEATAALLIPLLKHPDVETRLQAVHDLTGLCHGAKELRTAMVEVLEGDDYALRIEAALFFLQHEPGKDQRAIDVLVDQMADPRFGGLLAAHLMSRIRQGNPGAIKRLVPKLVERLAKANPPASRPNVIIALGEAGRDAVSAAPDLLELSQSNDLIVASAAVSALVKIDALAAATKLPSLLEWMTADHDATVRLRAIQSLRDLGPAAMTAIPALLSAADEQNVSISAAAIEAISKIDPITGRSLKLHVQTGDSRSQDDQPQ